MLQEDEEHWGSAEERPSSLAQDVCEVGGGDDGGSARQCRGGKAGLHLLFIPSRPPRTTQLLEEHTERAPRISQEFGERMAYCCLGGLAEFLQRYGGLGGVAGGGGEPQDPGSNRERRDGREDQGRMGRGASVGITGFAGLSAQPGTLMCSAPSAMPPSPLLLPSASSSA